MFSLKYVCLTHSKFDLCSTLEITKIDMFSTFFACIFFTQVRTRNETTRNRTTQNRRRSSNSRGTRKDRGTTAECQRRAGNSGKRSTCTQVRLTIYLYFHLRRSRSFLVIFINGKKAQIFRYMYVLLKVFLDYFYLKKKHEPLNLLKDETIENKARFHTDLLFICIFVKEQLATFNKSKHITLTLSVSYRIFFSTEFTELK